MRIKKEYVILAIAIGLILVNLLLAGKAKNSLELINREVTQQQSKINMEPSSAQNMYLSPELPKSIGGVTILGVSPEDKIRTDQKIATAQNKQKLGSSATNSQVSGEAGNETALKKAGVTIDNKKQVTDKRKEEMNVRGIIIY